MQSIRSSYASLADLPARNAAAADCWLSPAERRAWHRMGSQERRATWLAGRIVAKRLLSACLAAENDHRGTLAPAEIHIETQSTDLGHGQRPCIFMQGRSLDWALSIAHTARGVLAAVASEPGVTLGVDLVCCQDRPADRLEWCFTAAERRWLAAAPAHRRVREQLWAMKEALYKACQQGEGFAPGRIEVVPGAEPRYPAIESSRAVRSLQGWRVDGQFAALAVAVRGPSGTVNSNGRHDVQDERTPRNS